MKIRLILMTSVILGLSNFSFGWAVEYPSSRPVGCLSGWPGGMDTCVNSPQRVAGFSVNPNFELFYKGTTEQLNAFLQDCSKLQQCALLATVHSDSKRQSMLWPQKMSEENYQGFDWKLTVLQRRNWFEDELFTDISAEHNNVVAVDIWLDEGIDKQLLSIPDNILQRSSLVDTYSEIMAVKRNISRIVDGNTAFAFNLYSELIKNRENLEKTGGNLFVSPYSISTALAMTYAGAKGQTESEMRNTLCFFEPQAEFHKPCSLLEETINEQGKKGDYQLSIANALWAQKDYKFLDSFIDLNKQYYEAGLENVDFIDGVEREKTRQKINTWAEEQTKKKIKELVPKGILDHLTRLVLTNAIYFKGDWALQFDKSATREADFFILSDKIIKTPMMFQKGQFDYGQTDILHVLELPYKGGDLSMVVMLPKEKESLANLEKELNTQNIETWNKQMRKQEVLVYLPRFKMTYECGLKKILSDMGMPIAFGRAADFSGMNGKNDLYISAVLHKAFVEVNEEGTEAAAATAVVMARKSMSPPPLVFRADHPFMFLIKDKKTGSILFMGRVNDPTKE